MTQQQQDAEKAPQNDVAKDALNTQNPTPSSSTLVIKPEPATPEIKADPKETAQEAVHQVMPKDEVPPELIPVPAQDVVVPPPKAAKGDDDLMSQQEKNA